MLAAMYFGEGKMPATYLKRTALLIPMLLLAMTSGCTTLPTDISRDAEKVDWNFIQSVGGMEIGDPYIDEKTNVLQIPVFVDFSGNMRVTRSPTLQNTGLGCAYVRLSNYALESLSPSGATDVYIEAWAVAEDKIVNRHCDMIYYYLNPIFPTFNGKYRLWYTDTMYKRELIAEFSL